MLSAPSHHSLWLLRRHHHGHHSRRRAHSKIFIMDILYVEHLAFVAKWYRVVVVVVMQQIMIYDTAIYNKK